MTEERLCEIDRLLRVAEDELSNVEKQRQFLLDQIASLKSERENLLRPTIAEPRPQYSAGRVSNQSSEAWCNLSPVPDRKSGPILLFRC